MIVTSAAVTAEVGVPLITPVLGARVRVDGRPVADQVIGPLPPVAVSVVEYGVPTPASIRTPSVGARAAYTCTIRSFDAETCVPLAVTVTVVDPALLHAPEIAPVNGSIDRPSGSPVADHVKLPVSPIAATVGEYAAPT